MARLLRCNRCGQEYETPMPVPNILGITPPVRAEGWSIMTLGPGPLPARYDLCEDCAEVLVEQFLVGAAVAPITQPMAQVVLPHDPMTDCQLVWNPGKGGFLCYHDDPELYHALIIDNAQNVAEGVPEQKTVPCGHTMAGTPCDWDKCRWVRCKDCDCTSAESVACQCECHHGIDRQLVDRIGQLADDVKTAGYAHSVPQRCSAACSEAHTYVAGCLLAGVVQEVPGQITPPACGADCEAAVGNHTNVLGTCLNNPDTGRAIAVVCPECKEEGSLGGLVSHMADRHDMEPDYKAMRWVARSEFPAVPGVDYQVPRQRTELGNE